MTSVFICFDSFGFVAPFSFLRERMRTRRCVGRVWEELGEGKHDQHVVYKAFENKSFNNKATSKRRHEHLEHRQRS